jgi:Peptidase family S41
MKKLGWLGSLLALFSTVSSLAAQERRVDAAFPARQQLFQQTLATLSPAEALNVYAEVVEKIATLHPDAARATPEKLYLAGLQEFEKSLEKPEFREAYLAKSSLAKRLQFQVRLRTTFRTKLPTTSREARERLYDVMLDAQAFLPWKSATIVAFEFIFGASQCLDPWTHFAATSSLPMLSLPTVTDVAMLPSRDSVGYLHITSFRESTLREVQEAVAQLQTLGMKSLIIDLRGNPGGLLSVAVQVTQLFQAEGTIVSTQGRHADVVNRVYTAPTGAMVYDFPLAVLVDGKTMSAAEVVANAWKEHRRAVLVGTATFGKGLVQSTPLALPSGELIVTIAYLFGPQGQPLNGHGVTPHHLESDATRQLELAGAKMQEAQRR